MFIYMGYYLHMYFLVLSTKRAQKQQHFSGEYTNSQILVSYTSLQ